MSRTLTAVAVALVALVLPASAQAVVAHGPEPVGDEVAFGIDLSDELCGDLTPTDAVDGSAAFDLTRVSVRHQRYHVALTARFAEPRAQRSVEFFLQTPQRRWLVDFDRVHGHRYFDFLPEPHWTLADEDVDGDGTADCQVWSGGIAWGTCRDAHAHASMAADHRAVTVVLPRRCLGNPRWVRAGAVSAGTLGRTAVVDFWDPSGPDVSEGPLGWNPNQHVYGERVLAGPQAAVGTPQSGSPSNRSRVASSSTDTRRSFVISRTGFPIGTTAATAY